MAKVKIFGWLAIILLSYRFIEDTFWSIFVNSKYSISSSIAIIFTTSWGLLLLALSILIDLFPAIIIYYLMYKKNDKI